MSYQVVRSDDEIAEQLNRALDGQDGGSKFPGMSFENGVQETIDWLTGQSDDPPLPDED